MAGSLTWVVVSPEFDVAVEFHGGRVWVHHRVFRWNPRVYRAILAELARLHDAYGPELWVLDNDPERTPLLPKYLNLLAFQPAELIPNEGRIRTAFVKRQRLTDG